MQLIDWEKEFGKRARSISIQNVNPSPSQGSRNIFAEDRPAIIAAALRHDYRQITVKPIACFVRKIHSQAHNE
jgi:hypothetical protein